ncbi:MAG: tRNA 2-thiouridine(34) synthase MnmA [Eubacterium sp.]|nr:tRNA 2-thiouridine(34) synthase MnmA [Eubacterium sp.]
MTEKPTALIAMSGGVDSSVAAALMVQRGYDCIGVTMKLRSSSDCACTDKSCCTADDAEDARNAAYSMGMKFYVFNFVDEFERDVIGRFISAYENGQTPNPCIDCNRYMKFELLYQRGRALGCEYIVTGHYARTEFLPEYGRWVLKKARNLAKDQSYVLYSMTQEQLSHTIYPLGEFESKDEVRALADKLGLMNAHKHDSQDICFVPDGDYAEFIRMRTGKTYPHGAFLDTDGNVIGEHSGIIRYTIGQRKGLGVGFGERMYVCSKDMQNNTVTLSREDGLYSSRLTAGDFNWILWENAPSEPVEVSARTRYNGREAEAMVWADPDGTVHVEFRKPQRAVTAGQAVVLYLGDIVVGGGTILSAE